MSSNITVPFGRLTADADIKFLQSGAACLEFTVADNHRKKSGDEWSDDGTTFWRVTLWRDDAEAHAEKLLKGVVVIVTGEPRVVEYEARDGSKGKSAEIRNAIVGIRAPRGGKAKQPRPEQERGQQQQQQDPWATGGAQNEDTPPW